MPTVIGSLTRAASRQDNEKLNIISFSTHEAYQQNLSATNHEFYLVQGPGIKPWEVAYRPLPENHHLLDENLGHKQIPVELDFDLVLSQNKFGQYGLARQIADQLHLPLVSLEHTLPMKEWSEGRLRMLKEMRGNINVFISEYSREKWGWKEDEANVIHHGIDVRLFAPRGEERASFALSVVNDWINRDHCCGFNLWKQGTTGLPVRVVGNTPGLSKPAASTEELAGEYARARVFVNTSTVSPIPTSLLEAMSSGCAVVTTSNCMIGQIVKNDHNGLLGDTPAEIGKAVRRLLADANLAERLGREARKTVEEKFSLKAFVQNWNNVFERAIALPYSLKR